MTSENVTYAIFAIFLIGGWVIGLVIMRHRERMKMERYRRNDTPRRKDGWR